MCAYHTLSMHRCVLSSCAHCHKSLQVGRVLKDISTQNLSLYWQVRQATAPSGPSNMADSTWQHVNHPSHLEQTAAQPAVDNSIANGSHVLQSAAHDSGPVTDKHVDDITEDFDTAAERSSDAQAIAYVLHPMSCDLRVSTKMDKRTGMTRFSTLALMESVQLHLNKEQICDMARISDLLAVWELRNRYAVLRPTGWRSNAGIVVSPRSDASSAIPLVVHLSSFFKPYSSMCIMPHL